MQHAERVEKELRDRGYAPGLIVCLKGSLYMALCTAPLQVFPVYVEVIEETGEYRLEVDQHLDEGTRRRLGMRIKLIQTLYSFRVIAPTITKEGYPAHDLPCIHATT